jgi:hypothetical protein
MGQEASRLVGSLGGEAWALHQLGTRLLCLGQTGPARASLIQALRLRQSLGDQAGELATRRNLAVLLEERQAASRLPGFVSSTEETSPVSVSRSSTERSIPPAAGQIPLTSAKTPTRLTRLLLAGILLIALILLVPAAYLGWGSFRPEETAVPPTSTAYVLVVETPVVEMPGAILYLPILPNQYTVPDE